MKRARQTMFMNMPITVSMYAYMNSGLSAYISSIAGKPQLRKNALRSEGFYPSVSFVFSVLKEVAIYFAHDIKH